MPIDTFAICNESSELSLARSVLLAMCAALQKQSERDFAPEWKQTPSTFVLATSEDVASMDCHVTKLVDEIPEAPGALAYHDIDDEGRPRLVLGVNACKEEAEQTGKSLISVISSGISHEACEERGDPYVNLNSDMPDGHHDTPRENCDWTQGDVYEIDGFEMSNYVTEAFFCASAEIGTKLDHLGVCSAPLAVRPNGYAVIRSVRDGSSKMIFGEKVSLATQVKKIGAHVRGETRRSASIARHHGIAACALTNT